MKIRLCFVSAVVSLALLLGMSTASAVASAEAVAPPPIFTDVLATHPYYRAIEDMAANGIVQGYGSGEDREFHPDTYITRAQFAKVIVLALGLEASEEDVCPFVDVEPSGPEKLYPDNYIAVAAGKGITKGLDPAHYRPNANITRAQVIVMAVRAAAAVAAPLPSAPADFGTLGAFSGDHAADLAQAEYALLLAGLVGFGPRWDPWRPATRGEAADILWRLRHAVSSDSSRSPQDILEDMSVDQRLDDAYRRDELQAFLDDADVFAAAGDHGVRVVRETLRDHPRIGRVIFDGDSLTAGSGTNTSYPSCLMARWPRPTPWKNIAVGGETLETILQNAPTSVDPFYAKGRWRNVVVLWAGTNDIALWNHLTALIYSQLKQYAWARQARGYTVVVLTLLPRSDKAVQPVTDFEARRQELNRLIRSEWEGFADLLVDVGADPRIGDAGDELDSAYYLADRVHLNTEGQRVVAGLVGGALRSLDDWAGLLR